MSIDVRLLSAPFDATAEIDHFVGSHGDSGALVTFLGQVRSNDDDAARVEALELRHYEPLTLAGMRGQASLAFDRWDLEGILVIHRVGCMVPTDPIVLVAAAARHRRDAFAATDFLMDHLKSDAWFWKREKAGGQWRWVEPRDVDFADLARWQ